MDFKKNQRLPHFPFVIQRQIGKGAGGMSYVYEAIDERTGKKVILKIARADSEVYDNILRVEAMVLEELWKRHGHPAIVRLIPLNEDRERPQYRALLKLEKERVSFIALEYLSGKSLKDVLRKHKPLSLEDTLRIFLPLSESLAFIHESGYTHLDLKPENVVFRSEGFPPREPVLIDFGIARAIGDVEMLGYDPRYCSPERLAAKNKHSPIAADPSMDVYSLGVMFFECLTGKLPPNSPRKENFITKAFGAQKQSSPNVLDTMDIPTELADTIRQMLSENPENRPTARDVSEVLRDLRSQMGTTTPYTPPKPITKSTTPEPGLTPVKPFPPPLFPKRLPNFSAFHLAALGAVGVAVVFLVLTLLSLSATTTDNTTTIPPTPAIIQQTPVSSQSNEHILPPTSTPLILPTYTPAPTPTLRPTSTPMAVRSGG